ncbi:MAG: hypothetical protein JWR63_86, partial [Conexibacter sp.]|nr:hypothetical protein [Conexibacter sp.]
APLAADLELMGPVTATLQTATDAPAGEADWCVALVDVAPDGTALGICDGVARVRGGGEVVVHVGSTAIAIGAGHRLRVDVAASNFPRVDVSPHAGERRLLPGSSVLLPVTSGAPS